MPPTKNNHQVNQRLLLVRNATEEAENSTRTMAAQPASGIHHPKKFMGMLGGNPSTQMSSFGSSFQYEERNSMVAESMEEYALASAKGAYEYPGEQAPMGLIASGGGIHDGNDSHWWNQKDP